MFFKERFFVVGMAMLAIGMLSACSGDDDAFFQTRQWNSLQIELETRPHPVQAGHNEFLLHLTGTKGARLAVGAVVRYRLHPGDDWIQAMPDGMSDVFRRALDIHDPKHAKLYVYLRFHGKETQLVFDLSSKQVGRKQ
ncbi:MAG: hypothetical protein Q9M27_03195 [Mariprofundaceae bacterium]|nr:hypothetical protein [Mariprofundaceae bacterium]